MSPRRSAAAALDTRRTILDHAVDVASLNGLEGLTVGTLAGDLRMSKAGVVGPFGSKEALQLAALERAAEIFAERVWAPAADAEPGLPRLRRLCETRIAYLSENCFPGGCFLASASPEFDGRPGPVRDADRRHPRPLAPRPRRRRPHRGRGGRSPGGHGRRSGGLRARGLRGRGQPGDPAPRRRRRRPLPARRRAGPRRLEVV